ncbi:hypothetical protein [Saccharothrix syringae]|uniref:FtsX extracellular domain-containing protein n=1 Tax=Saccharothrix syringae TaxID=103733 RepID=A0A5Q0H1S1_SACSY|nr:hypothetical protein [Saccharothrix syringae]QFZ20079.1 hypothetical protein EKG83_24020 [Saccharothrix syringae]
MPTPVGPRLLLPAAALALAVAALLAPVPRLRVPGTPTAYCTDLRLLFGTDEQMRRAAGEFRHDPRVREVREERTKLDNHRLLTGAEDPEGTALTPASLRLVEAVGVDPADLADELRAEHRVNLSDACADHEP